jgi:hypothetical protein
LNRFGGTPAPTKYICDGLYPVRAGDVAHAAQLFAVQLARRKYGHKGRCRSVRAVLDTGAGSTFEAFIGVPNGVARRGSKSRFTVRPR